MNGPITNPIHLGALASPFIAAIVGAATLAFFAHIALLILGD